MHDDYTCGQGLVKVSGNPCQYFEQLKSKDFTWMHKADSYGRIHLCCDTASDGTRQFLTGKVTTSGSVYIQHSGPFGTATSSTFKCPV